MADNNFPEEREAQFSSDGTDDQGGRVPGFARQFRPGVRAHDCAFEFGHTGDAFLNGRKKISR